jgi:hypothetical protein
LIDYLLKLDWLLQQLIRLLLEENLHCTEFVWLLQVAQSSMSAPAGNGTSGVSGTGPILGYSPILLYLFGFTVNLILTLNTCTYLISLFIVIINKFYV